MSELSENIKPVICRLCTSTKSGQLCVFGSEGENRDLSKKIKECISIQIQEGDGLSKSICQTCISKVEDFHEFQRACIHAQTLLEDDNFKNSVKSDVTDAEAAEAARIVERLQADGSALSITPVIPSSVCKPDKSDDVLNSFNAFSITPILRNSESSGDDDSQWDSLPSFRSLPCLKNPGSEDYVLMQEETFKIDSACLVSKHDVIEYSKKYDEQSSHRDWDIMETQLQRRVVLPPMWDVFERSSDKENVTHRRYVVSKSSFPCSLCGSCVAFHRQQSVLSKKQGQNPQDMQDKVKQEPQNEKFSMSVHDEQTDFDQRLLRELGVSNFTSQEVGMLDCPECGKLFPRRSSWKRHLRTHYEGRAFICPVCEKGFNRKEHLSRHMISHTGGRPFRCETCFKPFTRKEHLARHLACNVGCGSTTAGLLSGIDQDFSVPRPYMCDVCYQTFVRKEHMLRHRKRAHLPMDGYIPPQSLQEDDVQPYSSSLRVEKTVDPDEETKASPRFSLNSDSVTDGPEQIEVEVNLLEDSDEESMEEGDDLPLNVTNDATKCTADQKGVEDTSTEVDGDGEDTELDLEDVLRMKMNEAMRQAREGSNISCDQSRCEVCQKTFTRKSHLIRHLRRFHPQVELAYAAAFSVGNVADEGLSSDSVQPVPSSCSRSFPSRDEDGDADDENGSIPFTLTNNLSVQATRSKGGQHPCSICGKMFGRRYHLVRHRRTQHGVESVEAGRIGRPPKRLLLLPHQQSSGNPQHLRCIACGVQFTHQSDFQSHICNSNNNTISRKIGSKAVAAMAAKISDKLLKGKDNFDQICQSCGEKFYNKLELDKHVETHVKDLMEGMLWT